MINNYYLLRAITCLLARCNPELSPQPLPDWTAPPVPNPQKKTAPTVAGMVFLASWVWVALDYPWVTHDNPYLLLMTIYSRLMCTNRLQNDEQSGRGLQGTVMNNNGLETCLCQALGMLIYILLLFSTNDHYNRLMSTIEVGYKTTNGRCYDFR